MIKIRALYRQTKNGQARVCADISLNGKVTTLWFGVEEAQAEYLCADRSDAFVMALLPAAMRGMPCPPAIRSSSAKPAQADAP